MDARVRTNSEQSPGGGKGDPRQCSISGERQSARCQTREQDPGQRLVKA